MSSQLTAPRLAPVNPLLAAEQLQHELSRQGIASDVHDGYRLALVSVSVGLVVWCDGAWFWWRVGWNGHRRRVLYARHPAAEPARAARRVAFRYADLQEQHAPSAVIAEAGS